MSLIFNVDRNEGETPILKGGKTKEGKEVHLGPRSKPILSKPEYNEVVKDGQVLIEASARTKKELLTILGKAIKKYPNLRDKNLIEKFESKVEYINDNVKIKTTIGGDLVFKSILKTGINFYLFKNGSKKEIHAAINKLKGQESGSLVAHYHPKKPIYRKYPNEVIHLLHLVANRHRGLVYCYVEFFSSYCFLALLSDDYRGRNFEETYAYNVVSNKEVKKSVRLNLTKEDFGQVLNGNICTNVLSQKINRAIKIANKINSDLEFSRVFKRIINDIVLKSDSKVWTEGMIQELSTRTAEEWVNIHLRGK